MAAGRRLRRLAAQTSGRIRPASSLQQRVPGRGWRIIAVQPKTREGLTFTDEQAERPAFVEWFHQTLLPKGYPESVTDNYLAYVRWTSLGLLAGRIQSVLATQATLFAAGLGAGAIPMAAAVQWVLKDGIGHACAILYSTAVNTRFDADAKRYRFQSTAAFVVADLIAIIMPLYPGQFMALASLSSAISSMASVAQLAARARIQASFALQGNLADCARAGQTQAKLMSLLGTAMGAGLSWVIGPNPFNVGLCVLPLAAISMYCIYTSSRMVVLRSLNLQRSELAFKQILAQLQYDAEVGRWGAESALQAPTPEEIAEEENFALDARGCLFQRDLALQPLLGGTPRGLAGGLPFGEQRVELAAALPLLQLHRGCGVDCGLAEPPGGGAWNAGWHADTSYALAVRNGRGGQGCAPPVVLWHRVGSPARTQLRAVWHACLLRHCLPAEGAGSWQLEELHALAHDLWPGVLLSLEAVGWQVDRVFLDGAGGCLEPREA